MKTLSHTLARFRALPIHVFLIVTSALMMYPLLYSFLASMVTMEEFYRSTWLPFPSRFTLTNFINIFDPVVTPMIGKTVGVTLFRTLWYVVLSGGSAVLVGYALARLRFRGKEFVFMLLLSSTMLPPIVQQLPVYIMMARFPMLGGNNIMGQGGSGMINTLPSLLLPSIVAPYVIFLLRQSIFTIPIEYEEAARIDGANFIKILWYVYVPFLSPVFVVILINTFVAQWNDYLWPLMVVGGNPNLLPTGLFFQRMMAGAIPLKNVQVAIPGGTITNVPLILAIATIATLPTVLLYSFFQRYFTEGMQGAGLKG
jgi:multiple sugar transport system permease protein